MRLRVLVSIILFTSAIAAPVHSLDLLKLENSDAVVLFDPGLRSSAEEILRFYPKARGQLESTLLWRVDFRPVIILIGQRAVFQQMAGHRSYVAFAVPEKFVIVIDDTRMGMKPFSREATIKHELCHLILHRYVNDRRLPKWLDEGVAQWISDGMPDIVNPSRGSMLVQAAMTNGFLSLRSIRDEFPADDPELGLAYEQSRAIVEHIIANYGKNGILNILEALRKGSDIDNAVKVTLMMSLDELENRWQEDQKGLFFILSYAAMNIYTILFLLASVITFLAYIRYLVRKKRLSEEPEETDYRDPENPFS